MHLLHHGHPWLQFERICIQISVESLVEHVDQIDHNRR
jgi:hypothetical protein